MKLTLIQTRISCWLTLVVMLFATLAPSMAMAMAARAGEFTYLGQICSVRNLPHTADADGQQKSAHDGQSTHCPFCLSHAGDFQHFPEPDQADFGLNLPEHFPSLFYQSRFLTHTWSPAVARAPPLR